jgi:hypothetical protein
MSGWYCQDQILVCKQYMFQSYHRSNILLDSPCIRQRSKYYLMNPEAKFLDPSIFLQDRLSNKYQLECQDRYWNLQYIGYKLCL